MTLTYNEIFKHNNTTFYLKDNIFYDKRESLLLISNWMKNGVTHFRVRISNSSWKYVLCILGVTVA